MQTYLSMDAAPSLAFLVPVCMATPPERGRNVTFGAGECMTQISSHETVILAALIVASVWAAWLRFRKVAYAVRDSRLDPGFQLRPLGPRLRQFTMEVLLQAKVI